MIFQEVRQIDFMGDEDVDEILTQMVQNNEYSAFVSNKVILFNNGSMISLKSKAFIKNVFSPVDYIESLQDSTKVVFKKNSNIYLVNSPCERRISLLSDVPMFDGLESEFLKQDMVIVYHGKIKEELIQKEKLEAVTKLKQERQQKIERQLELAIGDGDEEEIQNLEDQKQQIQQDDQVDEFIMEQNQILSDIKVFKPIIFNLQGIMLQKLNVDYNFDNVHVHLQTIYCFSLNKKFMLCKLLKEYKDEVGEEQNDQVTAVCRLVYPDNQCPLFSVKIKHEVSNNYKNGYNLQEMFVNQYGEVYYMQNHQQNFGDNKIKVQISEFDEGKVLVDLWYREKIYECKIIADYLFFTVENQKMIFYTSLKYFNEFSSELGKESQYLSTLEVNKFPFTMLKPSKPKRLIDDDNFQNKIRQSFARKLYQTQLKMFGQPSLEHVIPTEAPHIFQINVQRSKKSVMSILRDLTQNKEVYFLDQAQDFEDPNMYVDTGVININYKIRKADSEYPSKFLAQGCDLYRVFSVLEMRDIAFFIDQVERDTDPSNQRKINLQALLAKYYGTTFFHYFAQLKTESFFEVDIMKILAAQLAEYWDQTLRNSKELEEREQFFRQLGKIFRMLDHTGSNPMEIALDNQNFEIFTLYLQFAKYTNETLITQGLLRHLKMIIDSESVTCINFFNENFFISKDQKKSFKVYWDGADDQKQITATSNSIIFGKEVIQKACFSDHKKLEKLIKEKEARKAKRNADGSTKSIYSDWNKTQHKIPAFSQSINGVLQTRGVMEGGQKMKPYQVISTVDEDLLLQPETGTEFVKLKMIDMDWIFDRGNMKSFFTILAESPNEQVLVTEQIKIIIEEAWKVYYQLIFWYLFLPFCLYLICTTVFFTSFLHEGTELFSTQERFWISFAIQSVNAFMTMIFTAYEGIQLYNSKQNFDYFRSGWNWIDLSSILLNWIVVILNAKLHDIHKLRDWASLAVILMWLKLFYWMRLFQPTAFFLRMLTEILSDIRFFIPLFIICMAMFANAFLILNLGREADESQGSLLPDDIAFPLNALIHSYLIGLGEFSSIDAHSGGGESTTLVWAYFLLATFITQLTFFNLLIAIMGDSFDKVSEIREQSQLKENAGMIKEHVWMSSDRDFKDCKYIFLIEKQENFGAAQGSTWDGKINVIKKIFEDKLLAHRAEFNDRLDSLDQNLFFVNQAIMRMQKRSAEQNQDANSNFDQIKERLEEIYVNVERNSSDDDDDGDRTKTKSRSQSQSRSQSKTRRDSRRSSAMSRDLLNKSLNGLPVKKLHEKRPSKMAK